MRLRQKKKSGPYTSCKYTVDKREEDFSESQHNYLNVLTLLLG